MAWNLLSDTLMMFRLQSLLATGQSKLAQFKVFREGYVNSLKSSAETIKPADSVSFQFC